MAMEKTLANNFIQAGKKKWAGPVVSTPKPDSSLCFCIDYVEFTSVTLQIIYPISVMDECINCLGAETIFSTFGAQTAHWRMEIADKDWSKTVFMLPDDYSMFLKRPLQLLNALETFQQAMHVKLLTVNWQSALEFLKNILKLHSVLNGHRAHQNCPWPPNVSKSRAKCYERFIFYWHNKVFLSSHLTWLIEESSFY